MVASFLKPTKQGLLLLLVIMGETGSTHLHASLLTLLACDMGIRDIIVETHAVVVVTDLLKFPKLALSHVLPLLLRARLQKPDEQEVDSRLALRL